MAKTTFKSVLIKLLQSMAVRTVLVKLLGRVSGGFRVWLVSVIVEELFERLAEPIIDYAFRRGKFYLDVREGVQTLRYVEKAKDENNRDNYADHIGRV